MTATRSVSKTLAPLVQQMELEQPRVVTRAQLESWASIVGLDWSIQVTVRRLREAGWLLDLKTRGVWEFAPGARAGAFGSGDPLIELRATLAHRSSLPLSVGAESAAYLLGLVSRRPDTEVIGAPEGVRLPKGLTGMRLVYWTPMARQVVKDGLPIWSVETLVAFMGSKPSGYRDWPNVGEWLRDGVGRADLESIEAELQGQPRSAWARVSYLISKGGRESEAISLIDSASAPPGKGPFYLGRRGAPGRYDARFDVVDAVGMEVSSP
ncbi:MAG: type IV toxin-antitoxin system AbiEi family antitoxin [Coriobacteriia bacterium]|nr:type IV toxin-antitoxin system AbiEi family antitoxin [Coriobacteriia bacterium]